MSIIRVFFYISLFALSHTVLAETWQPLEVEVLVEPNGSSRQYFAHIDGSSKPLQLFAQNQSTQANFKRLTSGDVIAGEAKIVDEHDIVVFRSIERVGLRKLLGLWKVLGKNEIYLFHDFTKLELYREVYLPIVTKISSLTYFVSPSETDEWNLLMSKEYAAPVLASVKISDNSAMIRLFDGDTGEETDTIRLIRIKSQ